MRSRQSPEPASTRGTPLDADTLRECLGRRLPDREFATSTLAPARAEPVRELLEDLRRAGISTTAALERLLDERLAAVCEEERTNAPRDGCTAQPGRFSQSGVVRMMLESRAKSAAGSL